MDKIDLNKLDSIIWHELGHFIIDSMFVKNYKEYVITKFEIEKNVGGKIKIEKINNEKFNPFENIEILRYYIVNLTFGVILESIYLTINSSKEIKPSELFRFKESGSDDLSKFKDVKGKISHDHLEDIVKSKFEEFHGFLLNDNSTIPTLETTIIEIKNKLQVSSLNENLFELKKEHIEFFQNEILKPEELELFFQRIQVYLDRVENAIAKIYYGE